MDVETALLLIWEAGIDSVGGVGDTVPSRQINLARRALGLPSRRELESRRYWTELLDVSDEELDTVLADAGVLVRSGTKRLPKGSIRKLRRHAGLRIAAASSRAVDERRRDISTEDPAEGFTWRAVGHERSLRYLSFDEILGIHYSLVEDFATSDDPISPAGPRSEERLDSAVHRPRTSLEGVRKYPTVEMAAAALAHSIVHSHAFHNGNKRTALVSMLVFLDANGLMMTCGDDDLFKVTVKLSQHKLVPEGRKMADRETLHLADWLCSNSRIAERGERPLPFRRLRQILVAYGCTIDISRPTGNKVQITRVVHERKGRRGKQKEVTLSAWTRFTGEGSELMKGGVAKLRRELHLDDAHGIDSRLFYNPQGSLPTGEFIQRYRKILARLGRFG